MHSRVLEMPHQILEDGVYVDTPLSARIVFFYQAPVRLMLSYGVRIPIVSEDIELRRVELRQAGDFWRETQDPATLAWANEILTAPSVETWSEVYDERAAPWPMLDAAE